MDHEDLRANDFGVFLHSGWSWASMGIPQFGSIRMSKVLSYELMKDIHPLKGP